MLDLSWKKLEEIPTIELMVQALNLSNNSISKIPALFTSLSSLHTVDLSNNAIVSLPAMPRTLKFLNLSGNRLNEVAVNEMLVKSCKSPWNLEKLWLTGNDLKDFPIELIKLSNLDFLSLSGNKIRDIPTQVRQLEKLKFLGLSDNLIVDAEAVLLLLPQLQGVGLSGNPLKDSEIQIHRLRHRMKVLRVSQDKPTESTNETTVSSLDVQLSRKGTKLLKKKTPAKRPMTLAGLPATFLEHNSDNDSSVPGKILEEEDGESPFKAGTPGFPKSPLKTTASLTAFEYRDNIDALVDYYFNSEDNISIADLPETPHRVEMSYRHSKITSQGKARVYYARRSKSENALNEKSMPLLI